ncbi:MAG: RNA polymerase factor sigma-54 [Azospirillaceae bacterium]
MVLTQRLDLRTTQSLVMTPQLQQAIKLLQLTNVELGQFVEDQIAANPFLEHEEARESARDDAASAEAPDPPAENEAGNREAASGEIAADRALEAGFGADDTGTPIDISYRDVWDDSDLGPGTDGGESGDGSAFRMAGSGGRPEGETGDWSAGLRAPETLQDRLRALAGLSFRSLAERACALAFIDALAPTGYVEEDPEAVAGRLGIDPATAVSVLARLQQLEEPGLFARDLAECLALQLKARDRLDPAMRTLLDNLDLVARSDVAGLMRRCGVDREDVVEMLAEIRTLNPKPGLRFEIDPPVPAEPDILMMPATGGGWRLELNPQTLPRVLIDREYYDIVRATARREDERSFLSESLNAASWLVKALDQRARTILKVAGEIVRRQDAFFHKGVSALRPLTLKMVAESVDMHESTVSRVTANKVIATPRGLFDLKYFFTVALGRTDAAGDHSAEAVRHRIRTLIQAEGADHVLSDDQIVTILNNEGIDIARRTVAKYREAMDIPSSVQRRRTKSAGL